MLMFDFDGVLIDSVDEVAVSAHNAITGGRATSLDELPGGLTELFRRNRYHGQTAPDIYQLMVWCLDHTDQPDRHLSAEQYERIIKEADLSPEDRREQFFAARKQFVEAAPDAWLSLHTTFQPLWDELIRRGGDRIILLTSKNRHAAAKLCRHFGLDVSGQNIYSGDGGTTKTENLDQIHDRFGKSRYTFIDDNVKNLRQVDGHFSSGEATLRPVLASWGYVGPSDEDEARTAGFPVFDQQDLIGILDRELPE